MTVMMAIAAAPRLVATTVVAMQTKETMIIGTDSRATSIRVSPGHQESEAGQVCKMFVSNATAVAIAGIRGDLAGFDTLQFLQSKLPASGGLPNAADELVRAVIGPLRAIIARLDGAGGAGRQILPGRPALSVMMARHEDGAMKLAIRDIVFTGTHGAPEFRVLATNCPGNCAGFNMVFAAGANDRILQFTSSHSNHLRLTDYRFAVKLIQLEADADPDNVSPPYAILEGDRNGFRWIAPGACGGQIDSTR